jgi:6-phosphogluconolactonase
MRRRTLGTPLLLVVVGVGFFSSGCSTSRRVTVCNAASGSTCTCGAPDPAACPADFTPLLYATTTSNQILGFTISSTGALTVIPPVTGPTDSNSVSIDSNALEFADTSTNSVDAIAVDLVTGASMPIQGSPFSLGTGDGGPTSIMVGPYGYLYATEPNGTIVGLNTSSEVGSFGSPLPGSPYPAGVAPSQMAFSAQGDSGTFFLYASDAGDSTGGVLAYSLNSSGALTPIQGSPFPTLPSAKPSFVLSGAYYPSPGNQGAQFLFVSLSDAAAVAVFAIDQNTGALTAVPGSPFSVGNGPATLVLDDANHLFVMNAVDHTVAAFNLASNGSLSAIGAPVSVGTANGGMAFKPWTQLYVADTIASAIWTLNLDSTTGQISLAGGPLTVSSPPLQLAFVSPF